MKRRIAQFYNLFFGSAKLIVATFALLEKYSDLYQSHSPYGAIVAPILSVLRAAVAPSSSLAKNIKAKAAALLKKLAKASEEAVKKLYPLQMQRRKAVPLKEYTPRVDEKFQPGKIKDPDQQRLEVTIHFLMWLVLKKKKFFSSFFPGQIKKLQKQHKKYFKGAVRELRKDSHFIATVRAKEQKEKDAAYGARIKNIESMLQKEQADLKATAKAAQGNSKKRQRGVL